MFMTFPSESKLVSLFMVVIPFQSLKAPISYLSSCPLPSLSISPKKPEDSLGNRKTSAFLSFKEIVLCFTETSEGKLEQG